MFSKTIINKYQENLLFCSNYWLNDNHGHSGSLLNLDDLSQVEQDKTWNHIFETYKSDSLTIKKFRDILKRLIHKETISQCELDLSEVKYICGGKSAKHFNFTQACDLVNWWKLATISNSGDEHIHKTEVKHLKECFNKDGKLNGVSGFIKRSWHKGLMVSNSDGNHRIGNIANICTQNPQLKIPYIEQLTKYQINQESLQELLKNYAIYLIIEKSDREISITMDNICENQKSFCLILSERCTIYSLSHAHFDCFNIRIYFLEKSYKNFLLRAQLNKKFHKNNLIRDLLRDKL